MKLNSLFTVIIILLWNNLNAQTDHRIIIDPGVIMLNDSIQNSLFIETMNAFLTEAQGEHQHNQFIHPDQKIETYLLLDEINGIEKSQKYKDDFFYKPHLTNIIRLDDISYLVQVSYIGVHENTPLLRASMEFIAHTSEDSFMYSSPLRRNTRNWKTLTLESTLYHYETSINENNTQAYKKLANEFDHKLKSENKTTEFYCCNSLFELMRLIGVTYKLDYNGMESGSTSSMIGNHQLIVLGNNNAHFDNFDPHDLWHDRLSMVVSRSSVYHPIDEGCAFLYGGSWGISWEEILERFYTKIASNKQTDWIHYKENPYNFGKSREKRLMVDYAINALIVQYLEQEYGFSAVWEFLNCGSVEEGDDNYYRVLEKLTGITKTTYNERIWELVNREFSEH